MRPTPTQSASLSEEEVESPKQSFFAGWLGSDTETTFRSDARDDDDELESSSSSEYSSEYESDSDDDESTIEQLDHELRARHTKACKYMRNGDFKHALKSFEAILSSLLHHYGEEHHRVGAALHNVGIANLRAGKLKDAKASIEKAVIMRKRTLGESHPKVADSLVELGIIQLSLKQYDEALHSFNEALNMREIEARASVCAPDAKENKLKIAKVLNNIGCVHFERENASEAFLAFENAVKLQRTALVESTSLIVTKPALKPSYLTMACTLCNKGYVELEMNRYVEAIVTFDESLKLQKILLSPDNPLVISTMDNLGFVYTMSRQYPQALEIYQELATAKEKVESISDKNRAQMLRKLVYVQLSLRDNEAALESLRELESIELELYGAGSEQWTSTHRLMGQVNYEVLKHPTFTSFACFHCGGDDGFEEMNLYSWVPKKPSNGSKMSGHRVTYA